MDVLTLLARARAAGLTVAADGGRLVIRGPARAADLAQELGRRKDEVMTILAAAARPDSPADGSLPPGATPPCPRCAGPTHAATASRPGIVVLLCDDDSICRFGLALSPAELDRWHATGVPPALAGDAGPARWGTITLAWPPGTAGPVPKGQWEREADGPLVATYTREELAAAMAAWPRAGGEYR